MSNPSAKPETMKTDKAKAPLSPMQRKLRKLKRDPKLFLVDSKAYLGTRKTLYLTWAKLGSFVLVLLASLLVVSYYTVIASPRYTSQVQFVVKQANDSELALPGLAAIGAASPSTRDALIIQEYIRSAEMAEALDNTVELKAHYEDPRWDALSRLTANSTQEEYLEHFQKRLTVKYDELSEILLVELQSYDPEYSLKLANQLLAISEQFINDLGENMANQQLKYAEQEVNRAHQLLSEQQIKLVAFQNTHQLLSPESQSGALLTAVHQLEAEIIAQETELKSLQAYMQPGTAEIRALEFRLDALRKQLIEEQRKLTNPEQPSLNQLSADFKAIELNTKLAADLYASALTSLELARTEAFKKLKYLLIVEYPRLAQEDTYPKRLHSIVTWFVVLLLLYFVGRLIVAVIKEHRD